MRDNFIQSLFKLAEEDSRIILVTADLGFSVFDDFRRLKPDQFINAGVSEQNMTMLATGMALEGKIVFTYSIGNFPTLRCLEMIRNDAAYHNANVKVVCIGGGFSYGALGISHHATEDLAIMRSLPDVTIISPSTHWEVIQATKQLVDLEGTCYLRLDKSHGTDSLEAQEEFKVGKMRKLRDGADGIILVTGGILCEAQKAAEALSRNQGIELSIMSCHSIKPFDEAGLIHLAKKFPALITLEEHTIYGGLGGLVSEILIDNNIVPNKILRIGLTEGFSSIVGSQDYLRKQYKMDSSAIVDRVSKLLL